MMYDNYQEAIESDEWRLHVRPAIIKRDRSKCRICGCADGLQVHHIRYQDDAGRPEYFNPRYLVTLCRKCHQIISIHVNAAKARALNVSIPLYAMRKSSGKDPVAWRVSRQLYYGNQTLIARILFDLWRRTLDLDCEAKNFRNLEILRPIGDIVESTVAWQVAMPDGSVAYAEKIRNLITWHLAYAYRDWNRRGERDEEFCAAYRLEYGKLAKVKKNTEAIPRLEEVGYLCESDYQFTQAGEAGAYG